MLSKIQDHCGSVLTLGRRMRPASNSVLLLEVGLLTSDTIKACFSCEMFLMSVTIKYVENLGYV